MNNNDQFQQLLDNIASKKPSLRKAFEQIEGNKKPSSESDLERATQNERRKEELENTNRDEHNKDIKFNRKMRQGFSITTGIFMFLYTLSVILIVLHSEKDLSALIYTIPASMMMFGWVLQGLFPNKR